MKQRNLKALVSLAMIYVVGFGNSAIAQSSLPHISQTQISQSHQLNQAISTPSFFLNSQDIQFLKQHPERYAKILQACTGQLDYQPSPVATLTLQPHYSATGANEPDENAKKLTKDATTAYRMAFCYLMTEDTRYATTAQRILNAWATTFKQATTPQAQDNINFYLPYMVIAGGWVKTANNWNHTPFDSFLYDKILPLALLENNNNHGLWAVFMKASIGAYLGNNQILDTAQQRWQQLLQGAVAQDGTLPHELARSDTNNYVGGKTQGIKGIAYTHYALLPASMTAKVLSDTGREVWHSQGGQLLQRAFNRAVTLTMHSDTSPYYASNNGNLIGVHNGAYFPLLLKYFPNAEAKQAVALGYTEADGFMLAKLF